MTPTLFLILVCVLYFPMLYLVKRFDIYSLIVASEIDVRNARLDYPSYVKQYVKLKKGMSVAISIILSIVTILGGYAAYFILSTNPMVVFYVTVASIMLYVGFKYS